MGDNRILITGEILPANHEGGAFEWGSWQKRLPRLSAFRNWIMAMTFFLVTACSDSSNSFIIVAGIATRAAALNHSVLA
jgi:hypothetical protein